MSKQFESSLQERLKAGQECLSRLCPEEEKSRRLAISEECVRSLTSYQGFLKSLEGERDCAGSRAQLADRAFEAEAACRILFAEGLRSLNDLRDSGLLHAQMTDIARSLGTGEKAVAEIFAMAKEQKSKMPISLPDEYYEQTLAVVQKADVRVRYDAEANVLVVRKRNALGGDTATTRLRLSPQAGDLGRVSIDQFFSPSVRFALKPAGPTPVAPDCHHRATPLPEIGQGGTIDLYGAILGSMAAGRESIYRHARKASEYGHGATVVKARDPVTVLVVAAAVVVPAAVVTAVAGGLALPAPISGYVFYAFTIFAFVVIVAVALFIALFF